MKSSTIRITNKSRGIPMTTFKNPILSGFYPDPSICRVGEDYYLVTSTFVYYPGVPIFHSKDLVNWKQIGHVLTRESQINLEGSRHSEGIYAPTIRYHKGLFYLITTNVRKCGNFYVTAKHPEGPWSDPIVLKAEGIDPTIFFDEDRAYYLGTREKTEDKSRYYGDNEIWLQELDLEKGELIGKQYVLWEGALKDAVWPEGPHLYKKDGYYYLMIAEGGTAYHHAITIARSKELTGKYEGNPSNPILTHRHLGRDYPIINVGHGDLIETQDGDWWMVLLGSRPYGGIYCNMGRETFLVPVSWEDGWPVVSPGKGIVEEEMQVPKLPQGEIGYEKARDHFESDQLDMKWIFLRNPSPDIYSLTRRESYLSLKLRPQMIVKNENASFIGMRQRHKSFSMSVALEFMPNEENEVAGVVLIQNKDFQYRYERALISGKQIIRLIKREGGMEETIAEHLYEGKRVYLMVVAYEQALNFSYGKDESCSTVLATDIDARLLSTERAGGFVGTCIGMYASSNEKESNTYAEFDWFEYHSIGE